MLRRILRPLSLAGSHAQTAYESASGLVQVMDMHREVGAARQRLEAVRERRRAAAESVREVREELDSLHVRLDGMQRSDPRFPGLVSEEHGALRKLSECEGAFQKMDREEREAFERLSGAVNASHMEERAHAERTKYWGVVASLLGTAIGFLGSLALNHHRLSGFVSTMDEHNQRTQRELTQFRGEIASHLEQLAKTAAASASRPSPPPGTAATAVTASTSSSAAPAAPSSATTPSSSPAPSSPPNAADAGDQAAKGAELAAAADDDDDGRLRRIEILSAIGAASGVVSLLLALTITPRSSS